MTGTFHYDDLGRLNGIDESPTGRSVSWESDAAKMPDGSDPVQDVVTRYSIQSGQLVMTETVQGQASARMTRTWNGDRMLFSEVFPFGASGASETITYHYDRPDGLLSSKEESARSATTTYDYYGDTQIRSEVTRIDAGGGQTSVSTTYARDPNGNLLSTTHVDE